MVVQGGLLASAIRRRGETGAARKGAQDSTQWEGNIGPVLSFLIAKLIAYTIFGFLLGWLGSLVQLSLPVKVAIQFAIGLFMIGTALDILNVHPIFRYFVIQPPPVLARFLRKQSKNADIFTPALLGFFTVFIPCGTTQAMMALAIASGVPVVGSLILFSFILGTSPLFFALGYFASTMQKLFEQKLVKVVAVVILLLAFWDIDGAIALTGSPYTADKLASSFYCTVTLCDSSAVFKNLAYQRISQDQTIIIEPNGYSPNMVAVRSGQPVTLHLYNNGSMGCTQAFTIPALGIQKVIPVGANDTVQFVAPPKKEEIAFMCNMGMYRGTIKVI